jgi:pentafunctional AROM polypeptide
MATATTPSPLWDTKPKNFYIFGRTLSASISPTIHNTAFQHHTLPYTYSIHESESMDDVVHLIRDNPTFGGASVTMPHKLQAYKVCDRLTETAKVIGAVNTLVVSEDESGEGKEKNKRVIIGDNTDWSGLYAILGRYFAAADTAPATTTTTPEQASPHTLAPEGTIGLVIGAGGASRAALYAMYRAGVSTIYLINRTRATAEKVQADFHALFPIHIVANLGDLPRPPDVVIGTVPAETTSEGQFASLFRSGTGNGEDTHQNGLCIDMSYKPAQTPLLNAAKASSGWVTVDGVEVLLAQGFEQYRLWTGREAPKERVIQAVVEKMGEGTRGSRGVFGLL